MARDRSPDGSLREFALDVLNERLTVRELIRSRAYQDVHDANRRAAPRSNPLGEPTDDERTLNPPRADRARMIDWQRQFERALRAFDAGQILILIDDRQMTSLDDEIVVAPTTQVSFLRLTLLTGG